MKVVPACPEDAFVQGEPAAEVAASNAGDAPALEQLVTQLYRQLRQIAHHRLPGAPATLSTTALVHECVERMLRVRDISLADQGQFLAYASRAMRTVLVDHVRRRRSERRGAEAAHLAFDDALDSVLGEDKERELLQVGGNDLECMVAMSLPGEGIAAPTLCGLILHY